LGRQYLEQVRPAHTRSVFVGGPAIQNRGRQKNSSSSRRSLCSCAGSNVSSLTLLILVGAAIAPFLTGSTSLRAQDDDGSLYASCFSGFVVPSLFSSLLSKHSRYFSSSEHCRSISLLVILVLSLAAVFAAFCFSRSL